jgi:hypothetical protein
MSKCALDALGPDDVARWLAARQARYGISDAALRRALEDIRARDASPEWRALVSDLGRCRVNVLTRVAKAAHAAVLVLLLVAIARLAAGHAAWGTLRSLGALGTALTAFQLRSTLSVLVKLAWFSVGANDRRLLLLTLAGVGASWGLRTFQTGLRGGVLYALLLVAAAVTVGKIVLLVRSVLWPDSAPYGAVMSLVDRAVTRENVAMLRAKVSREAFANRRAPQRQLEPDDDEGDDGT